jgi:VCBS repeat-containing protein
MVVVVKDEKVFERGDSWDKITTLRVGNQGTELHTIPQADGSSHQILSVLGGCAAGG